MSQGSPHFGRQGLAKTAASPCMPSLCLQRCRASSLYLLIDDMHSHQVDTSSCSTRSLPRHQSSHRTVTLAELL